MSPVDREETGDEEVPFNEEWIACALKQVELGMAVGEVYRLSIPYPIPIAAIKAVNWGI